MLLTKQEWPELRSFFIYSLAVVGLLANYILFKASLNFNCLI
jgi:hypothetical protein